MARARAAAKDAENQAAEAEAEAQEEVSAEEQAEQMKASAEAAGTGDMPNAEGTLNAEDIMAAHAEAHPPELMAAQLRKVDPDAEIDLSDITPKNEGDKVVAAAKHGDYIIYVAEDKDSVLYKGVVDAETGKPPEKDEGTADEEAAASEESD
jgi:hypothetical protein